MNRWKMIIADDEMIIREGIRDSIDLNRMELDIVAEAEDGRKH
ncbi:hypothetical protein [Bacillus sp. JCM 19034]|nr:hypothetical protein [Bacillus sp. JCM 19034]